MGMTVDYSLRRQMQKDLIDAYKAVAPHSWTQQEAYERMVKQPAPRYYVTAKQAYQVIAPMVKGDFERVNMMLPRRRKMYYSLFEVVTRLTEKPMFLGKSLWHIIHHAVLQPAPEFFVGPTRAKHIRCWLKSGVIDNEGKIDQSRLRSYANTREYQRKKREERKDGRRRRCEKEQG